MDLYTLKPNLNFYNVGPFEPDVLIEGYDSLIWTERFQPAGDFELKTGNIDATIAAMPLGTLLGLLDSGEVMIVENHSISEDGAAAILTVTGRSLEVALENGTTAPAGPSESAGVANTLIVLSPPQNAAEMIETITGLVPAPIIAQAYGGTLPQVARTVPRNDVYTETLRLMGEANLGIRTDRHDWGYVGSCFKTETYKGLDKRTTVVFDVRAGHFQKGNYLWSIKDYKNAVYAASPNQGYLYRVPGTTGYTWFDYRLTVLDNSDITTTGTNGQNMLISRAKSYLNEHKKVVKFEGPVSPDIPYTYGPHTSVSNDGSSWTTDHDYYLGDLVKIVGKYGLSQDMLVTEFIRIEDETGERGYPALDDPSSV